MFALFAPWLYLVFHSLISSQWPAFSTVAINRVLLRFKPFLSLKIDLLCADSLTEYSGSHHVDYLPTGMAQTMANTTLVILGITFFLFSLSLSVIGAYIVS